MKVQKPSEFAKALVTAFSFLFVLFSAFAVIGYMAFGENVDSDILTNFPDINTVDKTALNIPSNIAKLGMVLVVLAVYPLMMLPMISPVREYEKKLLKEGEEEDLPYVEPPSTIQKLVVKSPTLLSTGATLLISVTAMFASFYVDSLGELNAASGAFQASFFVGIFPSLIAYYILEKNSNAWRIGLSCFALCCCVLSCMGFVFVDNHYESLDGDGCMWRVSVGKSPSGNMTGTHGQ